MRKIDIEVKIEAILKQAKRGDALSLTSCLRQAKELCEKVPRSFQARVLLAELFHKNNRIDESLATCREAYAQMMKEEPFDRKTVDTLLDLCQEGGNQFLPVYYDVFSYLCRKQKATLAESLYVQTKIILHGQFKLWKEFSDLMHSNDPNMPCYFIFKITSLAYDKDLTASFKRMDKLFKKFKKGKKQLPIECFMLHISILEQLERYDHGLVVLREGYGSSDELPVLKNIKDFERAIKYTEGRIQAAANRDTHLAADIFEKLFENSEIDKFPNNLQCFLHYISCLVRDVAVFPNMPLFDAIHPLKGYIHPLKFAIRNRSNLLEAKFLGIMNSAINWLQSLRPCGNDFSRFYYLAFLEIETRKIKNDCGDSRNLADLLLKSFQSCGHLLCFPFDVETFFLVFTDEEKKKLLRDFESCLEDNNDIDFLSKKTSIFKIQQRLGLMFDLPVMDLESSAINMIELFIRSLPLHELQIKQSMPGEDLPCLVCDLLVQLYCRSQHLSYLVQAVFVLEFALKVKSGVSKYIILLVHLYSHLGAYQLAIKWYQDLNLTFENRSMVFSQLLNSPFMEETYNLLFKYKLDSIDYFQEMEVSINMSYVNSEYLKTVEYIHLYYRLERCHKYWMPVLELNILDLKLLAPDSSEFAKDTPFQKYEPCPPDIMEEFTNNLKFQKAVESSPWWCPTPFINFLLESPEKYTCNNPIFGKPNLDTMMEESKKIGYVTMKMRHFLPSMIKSFVASSIPRNQLYALLRDFVTCGGSSLNELEQSIVQISTGDEPLKGMDLSYSDTLDILNMAVFLNAYNWDSPDSWSMLDNLFTKIAKEKMESILQFSRCPGAHTSFFVQMVTETFSFHIAIITSLTANNKEISAQVLLNSIRSMCRILEDLKHCFKVDDNRWNLLNSGAEGSVAIPRNLSDIKFGDRISKAMDLSWKATENDIIKGLRGTLSKLLEICEVKVCVLKSLETKVSQLEPN